MAKCQHEGCDQEATHSVTLNIPSKDIPIDLHRPTKMYVGVERCLAHAKEFTTVPIDWNHDENFAFRDAIDGRLEANGAAEADWGRTFHTVISLRDPGYLQFLDFAAHRNHAGLAQ